MKIEKDLERARKRGPAQRVAALEADLVVPPFPKPLAYVWDAYQRLRKRKMMGFAGPSPIEWPDIDAFVRRSGLRLDPWELKLVEKLDDLYLEAAVASAKKPPAAPSRDKQLIATASAGDAHAVKSLLGSIGRRRSVNRKGERPNG